MCFCYDGVIYIKGENSAPPKVKISLAVDEKDNPVEYEKKGKGAKEMAVSPDGKKVAYLENRETLRIINLESGEVRTVLSKKIQLFLR